MKNKIFLSIALLLLVLPFAQSSASVSNQEHKWTYKQNIVYKPISMLQNGAVKVSAKLTRYADQYTYWHNPWNTSYTYMIIFNSTADYIIRVVNRYYGGTGDAVILSSGATVTIPDPDYPTVDFYVTFDDTPNGIYGEYCAGEYMLMPLY